MTDVNLTISGTVESLHLEPGDRLIVTLDGPCDRKAFDRITDALNKEFAPHRVIVLACGLRMTKESSVNVPELAEAVREELLRMSRRGGDIFGGHA